MEELENDKEHILTPGTVLRDDQGSAEESTGRLSQSQLVLREFWFRPGTQ